MKIKLYDSPFVVSLPQVFIADSIGEWLLSYYGESPNVRVQVFSGGPSVDNEITDDIEALLANRCDEYVVLESPGDPATLTAFEIFQVIMAVYTVATMLLASSPTMPSNVNRTQQSPNNSLGQRENKVRYGERVEDIYGTVKSVPSLMMPTYNKYISHKKFEYGYYCVGRGYYTIADIKDGDTLISDITGASASVYNPFTSPNSGTPIIEIGDAIPDNVLTAKRSVEVDGITLKALNQVQLPDTGKYTFTPDPAGDIITQDKKNPNFSSCTSVGDAITVTNAAGIPISRTNLISGNPWDDPTYTAITVTASDKSYNDPSGELFSQVFVGDSVVISGFTDTANNGTFTIVTKPTDNKITVSPTLVDEVVSTSLVTLSVTRSYNDSYTVYFVGDGYITLTTSTWVSEAIIDTATVKLDVATEYTTWTTLPATDRDKVWVNVVAANGMYKDAGGKSVATTEFSIEIEKLDPITLIPTGIVETVASSLSGSVTDERALTAEQTTAWVGPARVRMRRTSAYDYLFEGTIVDEIKWVDLYSVSPVDKLEFGNKTTIHTVTEATARATAVKTRQLNCIASRKLPIYNGTTWSGAFNSDGLHTSGTISATSKLVNIIAAVSIDPKIGRRDLSSDIDVAQIYSVQQQLDAWSSEAGQFNYTLDTDNMSFEETILTIANAGFCNAYRQSGKIRLAFDKKQTSSTALFTHRNKKPNGESITRRFANDAEYDGVEFVYVDPETFQSETIILPLDGNYTKLKKFEIAGIRSFTQAWYRANREYQKIIGQRVSIETETTMDARSLLPNTRVDIVDNTRFKSYDGEIVAQNGLELTLSQAVEFLPSLPHSIILMRRDGSLQSITCTAGSSNKKVVLQSLPSEAIVTAHGQDGVRTIFSFAADSARGAMAYLVQEIDLSDEQYVKVKAINYSDTYYSADTETVPDKNSIIN